MEEDLKEPPPPGMEKEEEENVTEEKPEEGEEKSKEEEKKENGLQPPGEEENKEDLDEGKDVFQGCWKWKWYGKYVDFFDLELILWKDAKYHQIELLLL